MTSLTGIASEWGESTTSKTANLGGERMNPGIRILPLLIVSANGLLGGRMSW